MKIGILHTAYIGDIALLGILIEILSQNKHQIILFTNKQGAKLYTFDRRIQSIEIVDKSKGFKKIFTFLQNVFKIKKHKCDFLLVPHRSPHSALIAKFSGAKTVGFSSGQERKRFDHTVMWDSTLHESIRCAHLAEPIVGKEFNHLLEKSASHEWLKTEDHIGKEMTIPQPYIVFSPFSVWPTKELPEEVCTHILQSILRKLPRYKIAINGAPKDRDRIHKMISLSLAGNRESATKIFDASHVTLKNIVTLINKSAGVVTVDSAPLHIASGCQKPTVAIFGPTSWNTGFGPASKHSRVITLNNSTSHKLDCLPCSKHGSLVCPKGHHDCMIKLSAEPITEALSELVSHNAEGLLPKHQ